ncbi:MAG: ribonuclease Z [Chlorobi bacterium]|nr:ribonuclease Z [Chlorobiota bacterium]
MSFALTILGSSSALPTSERFPTAQVLNVQERFFLIDCGEGTQIQLRKFKVRLGRLNHIFISHLHGDHVFGLFGLLSSLGLTGREHDLHIFGPADLEQVVLKHLKMFDIHLPYKVIFYPLDCRKSGIIYEDRKVEVYGFPLKHRIPTCGFLFREKERLRKFKPGIFETFDIPVAYRKGIQNGQDFTMPDGNVIANETLTYAGPAPRSYAFCSDTLYNRGIVSRIRGVDMLYHEATFSDADETRAAETGHSTARQAAKLAREAGVGKLIIGHFSARYKDLGVLLKEAREEFAETYIAEDGETFSLPLKKNQTYLT